MPINPKGTTKSTSKVHDIFAKVGLIRHLNSPACKDSKLAELRTNLAAIAKKFRISEYEAELLEAFIEATFEYYSAQCAQQQRLCSTKKFNAFVKKLKSVLDDLHKPEIAGRFPTARPKAAHVDPRSDASASHVADIDIRSLEMHFGKPWYDGLPIAKRMLQGLTAAAEEGAKIDARTISQSKRQDVRQAIVPLYRFWEKASGKKKSRVGQYAGDYSEAALFLTAVIQLLDPKIKPSLIVDAHNDWKQ